MGEVSATSFTHTGLSAGTLYYYWISPYDSDGVWPFTFTTPSILTCTIPNPPVDIEVTTVRVGKSYTNVIEWNFSSETSTP